MTATIVFLVVIVAIVAGALWLRWLNRIEDGWDYCDACTSEPSPLERKKADKRIAQILRAADVEQQRRRVRAGDIA